MNENENPSNPLELLFSIHHPPPPSKRKFNPSELAKSIGHFPALLLDIIQMTFGEIISC
jgi:hypothetical protein